MKLNYNFIQIFIFDGSDAYFTFHNTVLDDASISFRRRITIKHAYKLLNGKKWEISRREAYTVYTMENR